MPIAYYVTDSAIGPDDADFFDAFGAYIDALEASGLAFEIPTQDESPIQNVQRWPILGRRGSIAVYDNYDTQIRHIELVGVDDAVLSTLTREALARLPIEPHDELLRAYESAPTAKALVKLTLSAPEPIGDAAARQIEAALESDDDALRRHAAYCMGLLAAPRFERPLRARREVETEPWVTDTIDQALQFY